MQRLRLLLILTAALILAGSETRLSAPPAAEAAFPGQNRLIAFERGQDLFVVMPDGGNESQLTDDPVADDDPVWSPDSKKIAFASEHNGARGIFMINATGSGLTQITHPNSDQDDPRSSWAPNGTQIVFERDNDGDEQIWLGGISGVEQILPGSESLDENGDPAWSPDGSTIVFVGNCAVECNLYKAPSTGGDASSYIAITQGGGYRTPTWSPDGTKLAFSLNRTGTPQVGTMNADGSGEMLLTTGADPAWSPDGTKLVYAEGGHVKIVGVTAGATPTDTGVMGANPDWQPLDGQCLGSPASALAPASASTDDDTDGDNIPDNVENNITHTDPNCQDTDGDGLLDPWEVPENTEGAGFDLDQDGDIEVTRDKVFGPYPGQCGSESSGPRKEPLGQNCGLNFRPDPLHKDVYVEIDWQDCFLGDCPEPTGFSGQSLNFPPMDPSHHAPNMIGLLDVVNMFRSAPIDNPDDTQGVNLNILVDQAIPHEHNCDQGASAARAANFGTAAQQGHADILQAREMVYRYAWSGHSTSKDYVPPPNESCPLPAFWEIIASGAGVHPLPEYDISPHGYATPGGRDILVSLAITWICQLYTFDAAQNVNHTAPCFRQTIQNPLFIPGLFPGHVALPGGGNVAVDYPMHMLLGLQPSEGVRQLWGRSFANLLGNSLGAGGIGNDPNTSGQAPVETYASWNGAAFAPPAAGGSGSRQGAGGGFVPIMPDFSLAQADGDGDGTPEGDDTCPGTPNPGQADLDGDGVGDDCDLDIDGDGIDAAEDDHPADTDNDGADNAADTDDDADGAADAADNCPLNANSDEEDVDGDSAGDACDPDGDGDGLPNVMEQIMGSDPLAAGDSPEFTGYEGTCSDGLDNDADGDTDGADNGCQDPDGDTVPALLDNCPDVASITIADTDNDGEGDRCEPAGEQRTWGDNNCSGNADPVDALLALRFDAGLPTNTGACPVMGAVVEVLGASPHPWGDIDCTGDVGPIDGLKLLRFDSGLSVAQEPDCPVVGGGVVVAANAAVVPQNWARRRW